VVTVLRLHVSFSFRLAMGFPLLLPPVLPLQSSLLLLLLLLATAAPESMEVPVLVGQQPR
jgi:hypothetical protein